VAIFYVPKASSFALSLALLIATLGIIISIPVAAILTLAYDEYRSGRMGAGGEEEPMVIEPTS
jgi:hypothetical protein